MVELMFSQKPTLLLVIDTIEWAYEGIARCIYESLKDQYDIYWDYTMFFEKHNHKGIFLIRHLKDYFTIKKRRRIRIDNTYDVVFFIGFFLRDRYPEVKASHVVAGIFSEHFPPCCTEEAPVKTIQEFEALYLSGVDCIVCGNPSIAKKYVSGTIPVYWSEAWHEDKFYRITPYDCFHKGDFVVGWSGNMNRKLKGYYDYVIPAVEIAHKRYPEIRLKTWKPGPLNTLVRFYDDVDIVLIASESEAGPYMFKHACCCEIPSISTHVGCPEIIINDGVNGFIVDRNINIMAERICRLYENRSLLEAMSARIKNDYLAVFSREKLEHQWRDIFSIFA